MSELRRTVVSRRVRAAVPGVLLALVVAFAGCAKKSGDGSPTILTVGSRTVSQADFEAYAKDPQVAQPYMSLPDSVAKRALLDDILGYELLAEAAHRQGLEDSAYAAIEETLMPRLLPDALYEAKVGKLVKVSEDEAKLFDEQQTHEYQLGLLMTTEPAPMATLLQRLDQGEDFAEVARTGSQDPGTAQSGGRIPGWILLGQLPPGVEPAVRKLEKGQRTAPIAQRTGTYVFQVFDVRPRENVTPFEQRKDDVMRSLEARKRGAIVDDYLLGLRQSHRLAIEGAGWDVINTKFLGLNDSLAYVAVTDPKAAGLTEQDLAAPVATWRDHKYTVADLLRDLGKADPMERPALTRTDLVRMFVEGHAMNEVLVAEAKTQGLADSPEVDRQVKRAQTAYLVNRYLEKNLAGSSLGTPTPAELDSVTDALVRGMGGAGGGPIPKFAQLPPVIQQQIVQDWQNRKRQALLKAEVERLKAEIKPVVNEKVFAPMPWPGATAGA